MASDIGGMRDRVGEILGTSDWIVVDQAMIDIFADVTHDRQFIHVDSERAKASPFGGTIAHGFLSLSLLSVMLERSDAPHIAGIRLMVNYGLNKVRFLSPVRSGARVRARFRLLALEEKVPGQFLQTIEATVEIEDMPKPALVAEWLIQLQL